MAKTHDLHLILTQGAFDRFTELQKNFGVSDFAGVVEASSRLLEVLMVEEEGDAEVIFRRKDGTEFKFSTRCSGVKESKPNPFNSIKLG